RHAAWYARKLSGHAFLNWSAIPRPMKPTQLTVLTSASVSSARMSPVLYSIIPPPASEVPPWADIYDGPVTCPRNGTGRPVPDRDRSDTDPFDELEGESLVEQELRLLALLHVLATEVGRRDRCPIELVEVRSA